MFYPTVLGHDAPEYFATPFFVFPKVWKNTVTMLIV